jgi:hypothetical protein
LIGILVVACVEFDFVYIFEITKWVVSLMKFDNCLGFADLRLLVNQKLSWVLWIFIAVFME